jgi:uncharacterized protein YqeY
MTLKEKINKDYIEAFKAKNSVKKNLLSVIKGEIQTVEKNTGVENLSDEDVTKILNKSVKSLKETLNSLSVDEQTSVELAIIQCYLPQQMSESEVQDKIEQLISSGITSIGAIMKEFSSLPVDKKLVSEIIKKSLV